MITATETSLVPLFTWASGEISGATFNIVLSIMAGAGVGPNMTSELFSTLYSFMFTSKNIPLQVPSVTFVYPLVFNFNCTPCGSVVCIPQHECVCLSYSCSFLLQPSIKRLLTAFGATTHCNPSLMSLPSPKRCILLTLTIMPMQVFISRSLTGTHSHACMCHIYIRNVKSHIPTGVDAFAVTDRPKAESGQICAILFS